MFLSCWFHLSSGDSFLRKQLLLSSFLVGLMSTAVCAQTAIEGFIRDNAGSVVPGASIALRRAEGSIVQQTTSDAIGKFRLAAVEAGAYTLKTEAPGFYVSNYDFVLRARQPLSLTVELQHKQSLQQTVEVKSSSITVDPENTGSSYTFTRQDLDMLPDPLTNSANDLVNNLMPGTSDSHEDRKS